MKRLITVIFFLVNQTTQAQFSVSPDGHYLLPDGIAGNQSDEMSSQVDGIPSALNGKGTRSVPHFEK